MIPDQKAVWDKKHGADDHAQIRDIVLPFTKIAAQYLRPKSHILELGCGVGSSAVYFAQNGHRVIATDISDVVIEQNKIHYRDSGVEFSTLDIQQPLPYANESFDAVFAHLSIHYFSHATTQSIVENIAKILKPNGLFAFACKSVNDFHYGEGEEVDDGVFVSSKGHARHFFTIPYTKELLKDLYNIELLEEVTEQYEYQESKIIRCIARKT